MDVAYLHDQYSELEQVVSSVVKTLNVLEQPGTSPSVTTLTVISTMLCLAPIGDHSDRGVVAMSISFPKNRVNSTTLSRFRSFLLEAAGDLSHQVGYKESALVEASS